jgi:hypothetical protein
MSGQVLFEIRPIRKDNSPRIDTPGCGLMAQIPFGMFIVA